MDRSGKRIGILTSSRADYSIYLPLISALRADSYFSLEIIAFGTHLSDYHGHTIEHIFTDGFEVKHKIKTLIKGNTPDAISTTIAETIQKFSEFWNNYKDNYDLVFCLGDRYEMFAAVSAGIPYLIKFAHIHGGESTIGSIDNIFRHCITLASKWHFASTQQYAKRITQILNSDYNVFTVGALSLENLDNLSLLSLEDFKSTYGIDLAMPTILTTFHPETVVIGENIKYAEILHDVFQELDNYQIIITMPNADAEGTEIRSVFQDLPEKTSHRVICVENFSTLGYFSCMKHVSLLLGNTSSGIIEAASLNKYVINLGDRQGGRIAGENVIHCTIEKSKILEAVEEVTQLPPKVFLNPYYRGNASSEIIHILKLIL